jgi:hypothetical protein
VPRGGKRYGTPGTAYSNRTDLQAVRTAPSRQYGQRAGQERSQRALPLAGATSPGPTAPAAVPARPGALPGPPMPLPGQGMPRLDDPTGRPAEPVTAGMELGAGAGPEANPFSTVGSPDDAALALRAAYAAYPSRELHMILKRIDLR